MSVRVDDRVTPELVRLLARAERLQPAMRAIGAILVEDARMTFRNQRDPWGRPWKGLSATTRMRRAQRLTKGRTKKRGGGLTKKAAGIFGSAQALLNTGRLRNSVTANVQGSAVVVGTNLIYAGTQQFGARRGAYAKRVPWGDVPARPFLPIRGTQVVLPTAARAQINAVMAKFLGLPVLSNRVPLSPFGRAVVSAQVR